MAIVPESRLGKIQFYEVHVAPWTTNAAAIGLGPAQMTDFTPLVTAARAAFDAAIAAREAAKAATVTMYAAVDAMHAGPGAGADIIRDIKNHALSTDDPNVYALAQIPPPSPPSPAPAPGTPFDFKVSLKQNGALQLGWKCANAAGGVVYEIKRSIEGGSLTFVGSSGERSFLDETLPAGSSPVTYEITGVRSTAKGSPAQFTVKVGGDGAVGTQMTIESVSPVKMAA